MSPVLFVVLFPLAVPIALATGVTLHELAHAAMGRIFGIQIREIRVGRGRELFRWRLGQTTVWIGTIVDCGMVHPYCTTRPSKIRRLLFIVAGPLMDLSLLAFAIWLYCGGILPDGLVWIAVIMMVTQGILLIGNLVPRANSANDIYQISQILRTDYREPMQYWEHHRQRMLVYWDGNGTSPVPTRQSCRIATLLAEDTGDALGEDAILLLEDELKLHPQTPEALLILDHLATNALCHWHDGLSSRLDRWTARAICLGPDIPTLKGTRGAALCMLERYDEAETMLAGADTSNEFNRFLNALFLARACHGRQRPAEAQRSYEEALELFHQVGGLDARLPKLMKYIASELGYPPPPALQT